MSHDYAFWDNEETLENDVAGEIYASLVEKGASEWLQPSPKIAMMAKEIATQWPEPDPGDEDESPWSIPVEVSESHLLTCIVPSRQHEVAHILSLLARRYELIMYDPQQEYVFLPPRLSRKRTRLRAKKKRETDK